MSQPDGQTLGYLQACMDRRFIHPTMEAFAQSTGLEPGQFWVETYPGGAALEPQATTGVDYAAAHGVTVFGWQAHGDSCGGQPGIDDATIQARLDERIAQMQNQFPDATHYRLFATNVGVDVQLVQPKSD